MAIVAGLIKYGITLICFLALIVGGVVCGKKLRESKDAKKSN